MILGVDEVGRGAWAGPLVVGAAVLGGAQIVGLTDSKKLTKKRREELNEQILGQASYGLGWVSAEEVDSIGLSAALRLATRRAVEQITVPYHEIIIDGTINFLADSTKGQYVTTLKQADLLIPAVSAASIVAKVARDRYMTEQHDLYPDYGFSAHVGYGTAMHRVAIEQHGVTPLHRLSIAPLAHYASTEVPQVVHDIKGTNKHAGNVAEDVAAEYLVGQGHVILERNWKTRVCEIDIVSQCDDTLFFTEVKYRRSVGQGDGLDAITKTKFKQMGFAATMYAHVNQYHDTALHLATISLTGEPPVVESCLFVD